MALATACSGPRVPEASPSELQRPSLTATATARSTTPPAETRAANPTATEAAPTQAAAATPAAHEPFAYGQVVEVTVDALAVRSEPSPDAALVDAWDADPETHEWKRVVEGVRIDSGFIVSVDLGPIPMGDTVWYRVAIMAQPGPDSNPTIHWDRDDRGGPAADPGWIAAVVGPDVYLRPYEGEAEGHRLPGTILAEAGSTDFTSDPFPAHDIFAMPWAVSLPVGAESCAYRVALQAVDPAGTDLREVELVALSLTAAYEEGHEGTDRADVAPLQAEEYRLQVSTNCHWSLALAALPHD